MSHFPTVLISVALILVGCREESQDGFRRAGSRQFSKEEAKAVAVARAEIEKPNSKRVDARYRVTRIPEGYSVHVSYVTGYQRGQPIFMPGGFCVVLVSTQWTVIKILGGA
jgi:hypothetical protein